MEIKIVCRIDDETLCHIKNDKKSSQRLFDKKRQLKNLINTNPSN